MRLLRALSPSTSKALLPQCLLREGNRALLLLSHVSRVRLCVTPQMAAHQAPPSLGFSRQEHWSGLLLPSPKHGPEDNNSFYFFV